MFSQTTVVAALFFASASLTQLASASLAAAHPLVHARDIEVEARDAILDTRGLSIATTGRAAQAANCEPAGDYAFTSYSSGQVKAAMLAGAQLVANSQQIGDRNYPHAFGNGEGIALTCSNNMQEFPILIDHTIYTGGAVTTEPDRVVFQAVQKSGQLVIEYCGVMRHGADGFNLCG